MNESKARPVSVGSPPVGQSFVIELRDPLMEDVEEEVLDGERGQRDLGLHETPNVQNDSTADDEFDVRISDLAGKRPRVRIPIDQ